MNASPIDLATFAELQDAMGPEFTLELVDTFLEESPGILADLRTALAEGDVDGYRRAAHSLKSNCNTFGALLLASAAREIELGGFSGDAGSDGLAVDALVADYADVASALSELARG